MTKRVKTTRNSAKRDLFAELKEGVEALADERRRKQRLRTHHLEVIRSTGSRKKSAKHA